MESRFYKELGVHQMFLLKWRTIKNPTWDQSEYLIPTGRDAVIDLEDRGVWHLATDTEIRNFVSEYNDTRIRAPGGRIIVLLKRDEDRNDYGVLQVRQCMQQDELEQAVRRHMAGEIIESSDIRIGMLSSPTQRLYGKLRLGPGEFGS